MTSAQESRCCLSFCTRIEGRSKNRAEQPVQSKIDHHVMRTLQRVCFAAIDSNFSN